VASEDEGCLGRMAGAALTRVHGTEQALKWVQRARQALLWVYRSRFRVRTTFPGVAGYGWRGGGAGSLLGPTGRRAALRGEGRGGVLATVHEVESRV